MLLLSTDIFNTANFRRWPYGNTDLAIWSKLLILLILVIMVILLICFRWLIDGVTDIANILGIYYHRKYWYYLFMVSLTTFPILLIYNHGHTILRLFYVLPNFTRSETKSDFSRKHGTYQLHQDLSNSLRLKMLRNWEI